jgi:two-component system, LytTR family, response regulator
MKSKYSGVFRGISASMRVLIVDDEPLARNRLRTLLQAAEDVEVVGEAGSGAEAVDLSRRTRLDVLFLDIQMARVSGFDVIQRLGADVPPVVIFTTAHSEYAAAAFDVSATDYIVKPFDGQRVRRALDRARRRLRGAEAETGRSRELGTPHGGRFVVRARRQLVFVRPEDVLWIGAEGNYVRLHTESSSYLLRESMRNLEESLDPNLFLRVHRCAFVNAESIERVSGNLIHLTNGSEVVLGPSYRRRLRSFLRLEG